MPKTRLILASTSPRRSSLLSSLNIPFVTTSPQAHELDNPYVNPKHLVLHNAQLKANAALKDFPNDLVLAADTTVALHNQILGKPADLTQAKLYLQKLSGHTHDVYTAICLRHLPSNTYLCHAEHSAVTFKTLSNETIDNYLSLIQPLDKAGSYAIQDHPELIIEKYSGSLNNIIGLPTEYLSKTLPRLHIL